MGAAARCYAHVSPPPDRTSVPPATDDAVYRNMGLNTSLRVCAEWQAQVRYGWRAHAEMLCATRKRQLAAHTSAP